MEVKKKTKITKKKSWTIKQTNKKPQWNGIGVVGEICVFECDFFFFFGPEFIKLVCISRQTYTIAFFSKI